MEILFGKNKWRLPNPATASIGLDLPAISDLREAIDAALSAPLDFSSLEQVIISGDVVALAIDPALPSLPEFVSGVTQWLVEHGTAPCNIRLVLTANCGQAESLSQQLSQVGLSEVILEKHDPDDPKCLSYVAANASAEAVYINRTLVDADVAIPVSCTRSVSAIDYLGSFGVFPLFSSREILGHLQSYSRISSDSGRKANLTEVQQAAWLLGAIIAVQVLPAADNCVSQVLCGTMESVEQAAQEQLAACQQSGRSVEGTFDLVIAVLDGVDQDWSQAARALYHAKGICATGGSIVLCTDLKQPIGPGLRRLRDSNNDVDRVAKKLSRDRSDDALLASVILESTRDHHVYLVSEHERRTIESLGLGVLSTANELSSLLNHHMRSLIIYSAQHA